MFIQLVIDVIALFLIVSLFFNEQLKVNIKQICWIIIISLFCYFDQKSISNQPFELYVKDLGILPVSSILGIIGLLFLVLLLNSLLFKRNHLSLVFTTLLTVIVWMMIRIQAVVITAFLPLETSWNHLLALMLTIVFSVVLRKYFPQLLIGEMTPFSNIVITTIFSGFVYIFLFVTVEIVLINPLFLFILMICIMTIIGWLLFEQRKLQALEARVQATEEYIPIIDELVLEVRARQHEFSNKILAISSIMQTSSTIEEAKIQMQSYLQNVQLQPNQHELLNIDHKVVAGFLYTKMKRAEQIGIQLNIQISIAVKDFPCEDFDLIEALGILLDNAFDACMGGEAIYIRMQKYNEHYELTVSNPAPYKSNEQLTKMFEVGFSTKVVRKGVRGYGLYNLQQIAKQYKGKILASNEKRNGNYITIGIQFQE